MSNPFISVIIPTYSRPRELDQCLARLSQQSYPRDCFEVVVVDDGGTPPLDQLVKRYSEALSISLVRQENGGPASARNRGAVVANGELFAFTDDDCQPAPGWLEAFAKSHGQSPQAFLGGSMVNVFEQNLYAVTSQLILDSAYAFYNRNPADAHFFASSNISVPAAGYSAIGGFATAFRTASEDRDLCDRWRWKGHRLVSVPDAVVGHAKELGMKTFCRQHFNYGRGAYQFHRARVRRGSLRFSREIFRYPVFVWTVIRSLARLPSRRIIPVAGLLLVAQCANAAGFIREALRGPQQAT